MSRLITRRRVIAAVVVLGVTSGVTVAVTAYASSGPTTDALTGQLSPSLGNVPVIQGTASQVLATLASRFPLISNPSTVAETVPASPDPGSPGTAVTGLKLLCDLQVNSTKGSDITQALWERDLFTGAVRDEFAAQGFGNIIDGDATLVTPDGARQSAGGGVSLALRTDQSFDAIPSDISTTVSNQASTIGLHSTQLQTMPALQDVLVIHTVSDSPPADVAALRQHGGLAFLLGQPPTNFEGVYLQVDDVSGNPMYITYTAPRDGAVGWWADPSLGIRGDLINPPSTTG